MLFRSVKIYTTGNTKDVQRVTNPLNCFAGGGSDDAWAEGWKQMLIQANGGDVVVIRADGKRGGYEEWLYNDSEGHGFPKVNSVTTILLDGPADAGRADVDAKIRNAEMVFFAGGYQDLYLNWITGTRMHRALQYAMHTKQIPFGGTSAGVAIMGDINYTAKVEPPPSSGRFLTSQEVMKNPTASYVSLERGFMNPNYMDRVILDTHFSQRQREGRLVGFMARAASNRYGDVTPLTIRGIGVRSEEHTSELQSH